MPARSLASLSMSALALAGLVAVSACGGLEWPPSPRAPRAVNAPPVQARSPTIPAAVPSVPGETVVVEKGDSIHLLARRHRVPVPALVEANGLAPPYRLQAGQRLLLPQVREHVVRAGESLDGIAGGYGMEPYTLARLNGLQPPYELKAGQRLNVPVGPAAAPATLVGEAPGAAVAPVMPAKVETVVLDPPPTASPATGAEPAEEPARESRALGGRGASPQNPSVPDPPPRSGKGFVWPVKGRVVSGFGDKAKGMRNDGVNIAAPQGAPVMAAESGVVTYAGNELRGFGNLLLIKHDGGWISAYAHTDAVLVQRGDEVSKGQTIAKVGSTGNVGQPQLHFELRRGRDAVDPLRHLPRRGA